MLYVSLDLKSKYLLVDKTGLDEPKVDETAIDKIAVNEPGPNRKGGGVNSKKGQSNVTYKEV